MKSIRNIVVIAVLCLICSTINMYAVLGQVGTAKTGTGNVKINVVTPLKIEVYPSIDFPLNGDRPKIARGDTKTISQTSNLYVEYTVIGGLGMNVNLSHNGYGVETQGTGVSFTTEWKRFPTGWYGAETDFQANVTLSPEQGRCYLRCYVQSITATSDASLGNHQIQLILTAAYSY
jgi:hypothetical protein